MKSRVLPVYVPIGDKKFARIPFEEPVSGPMNPVLRGLDFATIERKMAERMKR